MNNPLVSIIVPVYNVQNSVARCLESVLAQTWKEIEVIVLNDGSTDGSLAICEQFRRKDPRITLIDKPNAGLSMTRNDGMKVAKGKYVQFVDSDDLLEPDFTENMVRAAEANSADLVISPYWMALPPEMVNPGEGEKLATFYFNVVWNKLYRRQLLEAVDLWFTNDLLYAEDQQFNVRYLQYAKVIASIDTPGYYYIQNPQGICHTQLTAGTVMQNKLQMLRYYKELFTKLGIYDEIQPRLYKSLVAFSENVSPSSLLQRAIDDAASYWGNLTGLDASSVPVQETDAASRPAKPARASRRKKLDPKPE